jgi:hypothetical protein
MGTDLYRDIPSRQQPSHERSIIPVVLTPAIASSAITGRKASPACLPFVCGRAGLVPQDPAIPHHPSAPDFVLTDSVRQRPNQIGHPGHDLLCIPATTYLPHVALACQGLGVYPRRGYKEISRNATALNYHPGPRGPPRFVQ